MTIDNNYALFLLFPVLLALLSLFSWRVSGKAFRAHWVRRVGVALLVTVLVGLQMCIGGALHKCLNGQPYLPLFLGETCLLCVMLAGRTVLSRVVLVLLIWFFSMGSCSVYNTLVHSGSYIGTTDLSGAQLDRPRGELQAVHVWHSTITHLYRLETKPTTPQQSAAPAAAGASSVER